MVMVEVEAWGSVGVMPVALWLILFASSSDVHVEGCTAGSVGGGSGGLGSRSSCFIGGGGFGFWASYRPSNVGIAVAVTAMAGIALAATLAYSNRGSLKSPWSRRRRKHALLRKQWKSLFDPDGRFSDGGIKFLKKVRSGGVDPSIRAEVWPFLLGVYALNSSMEERDFVRTEKRKDYENLRSRCMEILRCKHQGSDSKEMFGNTNSVGSGNLGEIVGSSGSDARDLPSVQESSCLSADNPLLEGDEKNSQPASEDTESSVSESCVELESIQLLFTSNEAGENDGDMNVTGSTPHMAEDFSTWQRIIRLDALRANSEWTTHSLAQATVSEMEARNSAASVGLVDFDQLEPYQILHAARLVAILEAYALHDPEIGYCQGMSDLLSPIIAVIEDDGDAFWCFAGFMRKARHNFRLDEVGIRRQLTIVSKIIQLKDAHLYQHLEKLQASDCCFVYRMVVVLFRRELSFEQTLCLWEVMWADQVAVRAGFGKASWGRMRLRAPPTDDLLLYAIAACVLQRRKLIIEKYSSMEEIMRECNGMAGRLDVWKLLDDAHDLVVSLQDKDIQQASS